MALSRIWTLFIFIAVFFASISIFTKTNGTNIYSRMVTGKSGDTSMTKYVSLKQLPFTVQKQ